MSASGHTDRSIDQPVLDLLGDDVCRALLQEARDQPRTARELAQRCDQSRSTVYRKLGRLREAGLVESERCIRFGVRDTTEFSTALDSITATLEGDGGFSIDLHRAADG